MTFKYQGETYRDDRMFVLNLSLGKSNNKEKYILMTYRNTLQLPAVRVDDFETKEDAIEYIKKIEPKVPLTSLDKQPLDIPKNADTWEYWSNWLKDRYLQSAISGHQNLPHWVKQDEVANRSYVEVDIL